jgi:hypothetical protein
LSAFAAVSSARRGNADCCCGAGVARSLPVSGGAFESTSAPKSSVGCDWSGRAGFGGALWKDTLAAGSDVTLNTGGGLWQ